MNNPFTIAFGKKPTEYISRLEQTNEVVTGFTAENPTSMLYMITGVRGSGKTVLMTSIGKELEKEKNWLVIELNPEKDLLQGLAAKLYNLPECNPLFISASIDLSFFGIGVKIENSAPISDIETAIERMLAVLKKNGKKVLILIDEVVKNENIKVFAHSFQIFIRKDFDIFMLMTGLYENIYDLQNEKSLTFLYRAPKIHLAPLNIGAIKASYRKIFKISENEALMMANETKGYAFAYQVLGYVRYKDSGLSMEDILEEYEQYLEEYVYQKIWMELSDKDKEVIMAISTSKKVKIKDVREKVNMTSSQFSTYRDRLEKKGVIDTSEYGYIKIVLPRFVEFSQRQLLE